MVEDGHTEYKREFSDSIAKSVVAFSNGHGGVIIVGIDDDGNIVGLKDADVTALRCAKMLQDDIRPDVTSTTNIDVVNIDAKDLVKIIVQEGTLKPYYLRKKGMRPEGVYVRRGSSSNPATDEHFNIIVRRARSKEYESLQSFEQNLTFTYATDSFHKTGLPFDETHMVILGLKNQEGFTNLGFLLSDQCDFQVKAASFTKSDRTGFIDRQEITGSVLKQFDDMMMFIRKHITLSSKIEGIDRNDFENYPMEAVREIVLNAIVHRDYTSGGTTLVSLYGDSLEVASPGTLIEDLNQEDLFKGVSFLRNRRLSDIFYRLGLVEAYGTGIPRVISVYNGSNNPPEFDITAAMFRVTIHSRLPFDDLPMKKGEILTRSEIEGRIGASKSKATMVINKMIAEGRLEKIGVGKGTKYRMRRCCSNKHPMPTFLYQGIKWEVR